VFEHDPVGGEFVRLDLRCRVRDPLIRQPDFDIVDAGIADTRSNTGDAGWPPDF
jgi:hypothetical protein